MYFKRTRIVLLPQYSLLSRIKYYLIVIVSKISTLHPHCIKSYPFDLGIAESKGKRAERKFPGYLII